MGFFFSLLGYVTAVALMVGGAVAGGMWITRPKPDTAQIERVSEPGKRMQHASAALPRQHVSPKHALRRRGSRRHVSRQR
jgi:hypothetical protein